MFKQTEVKVLNKIPTKMRPKVPREQNKIQPKGAII